MKPTGPIPHGFEAVAGELAVGGVGLAEMEAKAGRTPFFAYSRTLIERRIAHLRASLPGRIRINYAIKANSYTPLLEFVSGLVDGLDIASGGELEMLQQLGIDGARISFAGPGKRDAELEAAIAAGVTLNLESENEASRALDIAERIGKTPRLAVRVNPDFELKGSGMKMGGGAKPFGIDAERVPALIRTIVDAGCEWRGLHIFTGSQALGADAIIEAQGNILALADRLAREARVELPKLNMGGGFGIPYFHGDESLDLDSVGEALGKRLKTMATAIVVGIGHKHHQRQSLASRHKSPTSTT